MADQLDQLPQFFATQSAQRGGGALFGSAGISALNMRAMGPQRTLVLLDGARVVAGRSRRQRARRQLPDRACSRRSRWSRAAHRPLMARMRSRASRTFGSTAITKVSTSKSAPARPSRRGSGEQFDLSAAWGTEFGDRWHFIGSIETQSIDPIDPDPNELGDWFRRYGIVANPAWTSRRQRDSAAAARVAGRAYDPAHADRQNRRRAPMPPAPRCRVLAADSVRSRASVRTSTTPGNALVPFAPGNVRRRRDREPIRAARRRRSRIRRSTRPSYARRGQAPQHLHGIDVRRQRHARNT